MDRYCAQCAFYASVDVHGGICRRHAPRVDQPQPFPTQAIWPAWPRVHPNDWCGEFEERE